MIEQLLVVVEHIRDIVVLRKFMVSIFDNSKPAFLLAKWKSLQDSKSMPNSIFNFYLGKNLWF